MDDQDGEAKYFTTSDQNTSRDLRGRTCCATRYMICFLSFIGLFHVFALRVNLSVAIVAMVDNSDGLLKNVSSNASASAVVDIDGCPVRNTTRVRGTAAKGDFQWDSYTQGMILGAFYYGYIITLIPGAWFAQRFGAKNAFGFSTLMAGILSLLSPVAADWSEWALFTIRVVQGLIGGIAFPAMHTILGRWLPPFERTKLAMIVHTGPHFGTVITLFVSGYLAEFVGWRSIFYLFGATSCAWFLFWHFLAYDSPENHPRIWSGERTYILGAIAPMKAAQTKQIPWKDFFFSVPVWAICVAHFGQNWGFYTLFTNLPTYLSRILHFDLKDNGLASSLPYFVLCATMPVCGYVADQLRKRDILSTTWVRRIFHVSGELIPAISMLAVGYVGCDVTAAVSLLTLAVGSNSLAHAGFFVNHIDISPTYAGILMGLTNTLGTIPGIAGPAVVGLLTSGPYGNSITQWRIVFYITAALYAANSVFYLCFSSGEIQHWEKKRKNSVTGQLEIAARRPSFTG